MSFVDSCWPLCIHVAQCPRTLSVSHSEAIRDHVMLELDSYCIWLSTASKVENSSRRPLMLVVVVQGELHGTLPSRATRAAGTDGPYSHPTRPRWPAAGIRLVHQLMNLQVPSHSAMINTPTSGSSLKSCHRLRCRRARHIFQERASLICCR